MSGFYQQTSFFGKTPNTDWKSIPEESLFENWRYTPIKDPVTTIEEAKKLPRSEYRRIKQKSEAWLWLRTEDGVNHVRRKERNYRKRHRFGASDVGALLGFWSTAAKRYFVPEVDQVQKDSKGKIIRDETGKPVTKKVKNMVAGNKKSFERVIMELREKAKNLDNPPQEKQPEKVNDPQTQTNFDFGKKHEANGIRAVLDAIKSLIIEECGSEVWDIVGSDIEVLVTPDGLWKDIKTGIIGVLEVKTKVPFKMFNDGTFEYFYKKQDPFKYPPEHYFGQWNYQCAVTKRDYALVCCWTATGGSKVYLMKRDDEFIKLADAAMKWAVEKYVDDLCDIPKGNPYKDYEGYEKLLEVTRAGCRRILLELTVSNAEANMEAPLYLDSKEELLEIKERRSAKRKRAESTMPLSDVERFTNGEDDSVAKKKRPPSKTRGRVKSTSVVRTMGSSRGIVIPETSDEEEDDEIKPSKPPKESERIHIYGSNKSKGSVSEIQNSLEFDLVIDDKMDEEFQKPAEVIEINGWRPKISGKSHDKNSKIVVVYDNMLLDNPVLQKKRREKALSFSPVEVFRDNPFVPVPIQEVVVVGAPSTTGSRVYGSWKF